jgi:ketosteroid isomerase-like protein
MREENLKAVIEYIDAYNRRDFDAAVDAFDPEVEWVLPERQSSDSCCGPAEVIRFWREIDENFDDLQLRPQEHIAAGDRVATRLRHYGLAKSGVEIDTELYHQVVTFRGGRMVRIEYFASWPEALDAAGVGD